LVDIEYNGHSIVDWLMLYNLYVTQNQPGADRLTGLFRGLMGDTDRVLYKYYKYIGNMDSQFVDSKILEKLSYDLDEILLLMAPTVNKFNERGA
jgi:hypothetical protein